MKKLLAGFLVCLTAILNAHPSVMTTIEGQGISLHTKGHSFAGKIKDNLISGFKVAGKFESYLTIIHDDVATQKHFVRTKDALLAGDGAAITNFDQLKDTFTLKIGAEEYEVVVTYTEFANNHFINPTYTLLKDSQKYSFTIKKGAACVGYSAHLIIMIFGTYFAKQD